MAKKFLGHLQGVLLTDGFQGYACLANEHLILANDWAHTRRKFLQAEKTHPAESCFFLSQIRLLFEIEKRIQALPNEERKFIRQKESKVITDAIYKKCIELKPVLPQSPMGRAIGYTLRLWKRLTVFLDHPEICIHTNEIERTQRAAVIGRKNHFGSKTLASAQMAGIWYSILATCEMNNVKPFEYLLETMKAILTQKPVLTPWECKQRCDSNSKSPSNPNADPNPD